MVEVFSNYIDGITPFKIHRRRLIWVKLLGFPLEFWTKYLLKEIEDVIGKFIYLDLISLELIDKRVAWILVELNFFGGLPTELDMVWHSHKYKE